MKIAGLLLMIAGWLLVISAILLLTSFEARTGFVLAGIAVEILGFVLFARTHVIPARGHRVAS
jgi:hypothetical protein